MSSFFEIGMNDHLGNDNQLLKVDKLLNWSDFRPILVDVYSEDGPTGYDTLQIFKCLILASWHSLSDPMMEQSLRVRLDLRIPSTETIAFYGWFNGTFRKDLENNSNSIWAKKFDQWLAKAKQKSEIYQIISKLRKSV